MNSYRKASLRAMDVLHAVIHPRSLAILLAMHTYEHVWVVLKKDAPNYMIPFFQGKMTSKPSHC